MITSEELFDEMEVYMAQYASFIDELKTYKLTNEQVNKVLLLVYQYRFANAVASLNEATITPVGDEDWI